MKAQLYFLAFALFTFLTLVSCNSQDDIIDTSNSGDAVDYKCEETSVHDSPPTSIDLFDNLEYSFFGLSGNGFISIDTSLCSDEIRENVQFTIDEGLNGHLSNGDFVKIYASCEDSFLENNDYTVENNTLSVKVKNLYVIEKAMDFSEDKAWIFLLIYQLILEN